MDNNKRKGRVTSSQMYRICTSLKSGKPSSSFYTYAEEVSAEIYIGRSSKTEVKTRPMLWGSLMEIVLFNELGMGWTMSHKNTILHRDYPNIWSGTPDFIATDKVAEAKCFEPKNFGLLSMCLDKNNVTLFKENFKEIYWQVLSNAVLSNKKKAVVIAYMPKKSELLEVIEKVEDTDFLEDNNLKPTDYYFLNKDNIESLPYLPDDSNASSINSFEFEVIEEDVEFMTQRVLLFRDEVNRILGHNE